MSYKCRIGHAVGDERGQASGGNPGDQTKREVYEADWYLKSKEPWTHVFRAKKKATRKKIAAAMEAACANDNIGYDQSQRTSLYKLAKENGWQLDKVGLCETDCSALVAVCVNAAGIAVSKDMYTGSEVKILSDTGKFDVFTDDAHCLKVDNLKRGDILLKAHHTAVVLKVTKIEDEVVVIVAEKAPASADPNVKGTYKVTADALNMRNGAGSSNAIMVTVPGGTLLTCDGRYSTSLGVKWLYVEYMAKTKKYIGFCSSRYLERELEEIKTDVKPAKKDTSLAGSYEVTLTLTLRGGAGTSFDPMAYMEKETIVKCDGSYTEVNGTKWLYITYETASKRYYGFASARYLEKK